MKYLTISVDDGHPKDLIITDLLNKYDLRATFYIPIKNPDRELMGKSDILTISKDFEIGGHTYNHRPLNRIHKKIVEKEIVDCKKCLEQLIGKPIISFCYPKGKFNKMIAGVVKDAGFLGARTCMFFLNNFPKNPYFWGVSTHATYESRVIQIRHAVLEKNFQGLINFFRTQKGCVDWVNQFKFAVDHVEKYGGIAHLYLHSWEIHESDQWKRLESLFSFLSKKNLKRVTNGELFKLHSKRKAKS
ncbi:MAG: polysaccharide deacetylase family protein [Candidatus Aminicenantaceae bacterium]